MRKAAFLPILLLSAVPLFAQMMGQPPMDPARGYGMNIGPTLDLGMMLGSSMIEIAPDGTVLTFERTAGTTPSTQLVAISPNGVRVWTYPVTSMQSLEIANGLVLVATRATGTTGLNATTKLVALTLAKGTVAWQLDFQGMISQIKAAADRVYVVTTAIDLTALHMDRTLHAVSNSGVVLWKADL